MAGANVSATFEVNLQDGTSGPAMSAANALQNLKSQIDADTKALAAMQRAMKNLQSGTSVNVQQFKDLKAKIDAKKQSIAQATSSVLALGGSLEKTGGKTAKITSLLEQLQKNAQGVGGPLGNVAGRFSAIKGLIGGGAIALGVVAIAAAFTALVAAAGAAVVALGRYGIAQADARRSELLRLEGMTKLRNWYGIAAGKATDLQEAIDSVAASSSLGRDQIAGYAQSLYRAHLRGTNLKLALEGMATKVATQGEEWGKRFAGMAASVNMTGGSVKKLADDVKARLGGIAAKQMLSLDVQTRKLHESFAYLFSGLRIESFLKSVSSITALFGQSTASGRALKTLVEIIFQPLIGQVEGATPLVKRFFQGIIIGALAVTIAVLKVRNWFRRTFGDSEVLAGIDKTKMALYAGIGVVSLFAGSIVAAGLALAGVTALLAAPFVAGAYSAYKFFGAIKWAYDWIASIEWMSLGSAIVDGIVSGLKKGSRWVIDTIKNLGLGAYKTFKSALGIASPSKAFAQLGVAIPQGIAVGVNRGRVGLDRTMDEVVEVPSSPAFPPSSSAPAAAPQAQAAQASASRTITIGNITINTAATDAKGIAEDFKREVERIFAGVATEMGAAT